jgi:hypothetical protein
MRSRRRAESSAASTTSRSSSPWGQTSTTRIVGTQREQIATMKALGYRTRELTAHHLEFALAICALGVVVGWGLGVVGTKSILLVYARYSPKSPSARRGARRRLPRDRRLHGRDGALEAPRASWRSLRPPSRSGSSATAPGSPSSCEAGISPRCGSSGSAAPSSPWCSSESRRSRSRSGSVRAGRGDPRRARQRRGRHHSSRGVGARRRGRVPVREHRARRVSCAAASAAGPPGQCRHRPS